MTILDFVLVALVIVLGYWIVVLKRAARRMVQEEIKKMEDRRSGFVSIISHQLRTPLSIIKGYIEALVTGDQGQLNDGQKEYLNDALAISQDSVNLVNDYLEAVKMDVEQMTLKKERVDLVQLVKSELNKLRPLALASNCEIVFDSAADQALTASVDIIKIKQVIENILTNAIKYSRGRGQAQISLTAKDGQAVFSCHDAGLGIPKDQQAELFTKFFRAKNIVHRNTKGSGLGLYLSKIIVEAHGGHIMVASQENQGTTVQFTLPIT
ncbi:MAG: ATP-binding protein [Patescibacteria group bacterium]|jgi:signal transduction histidine kinase